MSRLGRPLKRKQVTGGWRPMAGVCLDGVRWAPYSSCPAPADVSPPPTLPWHFVFGFMAKPIAVLRLFALVALSTALWTLSAQEPVVLESGLENGVRVLLAPRPGCGAIHAAWRFGGGRMEGVGEPGQNGLEKTASAEGLGENAELLLAAWLMDGCGAGVQASWSMAGAWGVAHGRDIAADGLVDWCRREYGRVTRALTQDRVDAAKGAVRAGALARANLGALHSLVAEGSVGQEERDVPQANGSSANEDTSSTDYLNAYAGRIVAAQNALIVLVGDFDRELAMKALGESFGCLAPSGRTTPAPRTAPRPPEPAPVAGSILETNVRTRPSGETMANGSPGAHPPDKADPPTAPRGPTRHVVSDSKAEVMLAWRIPPPSHPQWPMLELYAEIWAGSADSALVKRMVDSLGHSTVVEAKAHPPAGAVGSLFVISADLKEGRSPEDVQKAILDQVGLDLQGGLEDTEIDLAARRLETKRALLLADASSMAQELIKAECFGGRWGDALHRRDAPDGPEALVSILRPHFQLEQAHSLLAERDYIRSPRSPDHERLISLLTRLLGLGGLGASGVAEGEAAIKEALRQFGQMDTEMRHRLFSILETEIEKRM